MEIVLYQPDIPQNAGNIARTCSVIGAKLTMVAPLGFSLAARHLKRSGLDYWNDLTLQVIDDLEGYLLAENRPFYFFSSKAKKEYTDLIYPPDPILIFGSESAGLPEKYWEKWEERFLKIPMKPGARCLNLATSVGIAVYEPIRQEKFS